MIYIAIIINRKHFTLMNISLSSVSNFVTNKNDQEKTMKKDFSPIFLR